MLIDEGIALLLVSKNSVRSGHSISKGGDKALPSETLAMVSIRPSPIGAAVSPCKSPLKI